MVEEAKAVTPYHESDGVVLYHGDCREILPQLGRFDLLLTDPPYGLGLRTVSGGTAKNTQTRFIDDLQQKRWDDSVPSAEVFELMFQASESQMVWGGQLFRTPANARNSGLGQNDVRADHVAMRNSVDFIRLSVQVRADKQQSGRQAASNAKACRIDAVVSSVRRGCQNHP